MTPTITHLSKPEKVIYRTTTGIVCAVMIFSIINFIFNDHFPFPNGPEGAFVHLGLPRYFKIELTIAKILGVLALLIPSVPSKIKEFAYFGFGITFNLRPQFLCLLFANNPRRARPIADEEERRHFSDMRTVS